MNNVCLNYKDDDNRYDIIVIGGGTSGSIAAMAAAREGKKVLILEREYALGGTSTLAQVNPRMHNKTKPDIYNSSLLKEIQSNLEKNGYGYDGQWFNPIMMAPCLENFCEKYGVKIIYGACFIDVIKTGEKIDKAIFMTASGLKAYKADCFIDATGGAAVAIAAGCSYESGDANGNNQPMTLRFSIANVDVQKFKEFGQELSLYVEMDEPWFEVFSLWSYKDSKLTEIFKKAVEDGVIEERDGNYIQAFTCKYSGDGILWCNCPEAGFIRNANDSECITEMILYSRKASVRLQKFFKTYIKGFENCEIHSFATIPGIRESNRVVGKYHVEVEDYINRAKFKDAVAQTAYPIDIHAEHMDDLELMKPGEFYEIPFSAMLPKDGANNLLVSGRCISTSFAVQASMRIQPVCIALGEAAGIAAALYSNLEQADGAKVRDKMISYGGDFLGYNLDV